MLKVSDLLPVLFVIKMIVNYIILILVLKTLDCLPGSDNHTETKTDLFFLFKATFNEDEHSVAEISTSV